MLTSPTTSDDVEVTLLDTVPVETVNRSNVLPSERLIRDRMSVTLIMI